jgi:hypothetical protein
MAGTVAITHCGGKEQMRRSGSTKIFGVGANASAGQFVVALDGGAGKGGSSVGPSRSTIHHPLQGLAACAVEAVGPDPPSQRRSRTLEVLNLRVGQFGASVKGIFVLDDGGDVIMAGPFASAADALRWIEHSMPDRVASAST